MASQIYLFETKDDLLKVKNAIVEKLRSCDGLKFNGEYTISIEGWDVLTFLHVGMIGIPNHIVPNALYGYIKEVNTSYNQSTEKDVLDQILCIMVNRYDSAQKMHYNIDIDNITDDVIFDLLMGTNQDFAEICNGDRELVDDFQMTTEQLDHLCILADEKTYTLPHGLSRGIS